MADVQTVFGNINAVITQTAESISKVREAVRSNNGTSTPYPQFGAFSSIVPATQQGQAIGILFLFLILGVITFLVARELR